MRRFAWLSAVVLVLAVAMPVAAGNGLTYHGRITGGEFYCGTTPTSPYETVTGTWNLNVSGSAAVITLDVFYDGGHHLAFGLPGGTVESATPSAAIVTFMGGKAVATVAGDTFTWATPTGATSCSPYDNLVYEGGLGR